jgi:uncharacterized protein (TIGR03086 family)
VPDDALVAAHRRVCAGFSAVADGVPDGRWDDPTPCTEWDARALVEHVIGFHELLLLRPMGVRAHRPREGPAARWRATSDAMLEALSAEGTLDTVTELPGGGESSPRTMLAALTTDMLIHTWDLAVATGLDPTLDGALCASVYEAARGADLGHGNGMIGPEVDVAPDADTQTRLLGLYGRRADWSPPLP